MYVTLQNVRENLKFVSKLLFISSRSTKRVEKNSIYQKNCCRRPI